MGFLDKLSDSISSGSAQVAKKAKEVSEIATLTATIEKEKINLEKIYREIGQKFLEENKTEADAKCPELAAKYDESTKKIEEAKEAIRKAKGLTLCPDCGKEVDKDTKFCPACGKELPVVAEEVKEESVAEDVVKCPACGNELPVGTAFCTKCGTKLGE